jgi:cation:H+ antiporter
LLLHWLGLPHDPLVEALASGLGIFGAAFLLSWSCEVAQLDLPQALALALLALIAVLPEYAVDAYFAWQAGKDPVYTAYATANMTGANRLLIGVGWAVPVFVAWARWGRDSVELPAEDAVEVRYLGIASLYSFLIPLKGTLSLLDTVVLVALFGAYMRAASRAHHIEPQLEGPAEAIAALGVGPRRAWALGLAALAGIAIITAAEPFAEALISIGRDYGIEEFILVQWVAPLASESPEFIVTTLFALRGMAAAGISTLISSKVNQWTLLVGALPLVYALSLGAAMPMELDVRQRQEILLTSAQSLFAVVVIANFSFGVREALVLFVLFTAQLFTTSGHARVGFAIAYILFTFALLALSKETRVAVGRLMGLHRRR